MEQSSSNRSVARFWLLSHAGQGGLGVFDSNREYRHYLGDLARLRRRKPVSIYAFCLLPREVLMLVRAPRTIQATSEMMTRLAARHTFRRYGHHELPGFVWSPVVTARELPADTNLAAVVRWIELLPVRSTLVCDPAQWAWSSYRQRLGERVGFAVDALPAGTQLPPVQAYARWALAGLNAQTVRILRANDTATANRAG